MKIIKTGNPPQHRKWWGTCRSCGAEAEAIESELTNITHDQRERTSFSWERCPECGAGSHGSGYGGLLFYPIRDTRHHRN